METKHSQWREMPRSRENIFDIYIFILTHAVQAGIDYINSRCAGRETIMGIPSRSPALQLPTQEQKASWNTSWML